MKRCWMGARGQGILEFAVIFPIFMALVFVMIDGGLVMGRFNQVNHAAQEGARLGATGANERAIYEHVIAQSQDLLEGLDMRCYGSERICVEWFDGTNAAGETGSFVRVTVRYDYDFITPLDVGPFDHLDVDSCAIARLERPIRGSVPSSRNRGGAGLTC